MNTFFDKVEKTETCWLWLGRLTEDGYGLTRKAPFKTRLAHRISFMLHKHDPGKLLVLHTCHVRNCVNPEHLYAGTQVDNMEDMVRADRQARGAAIPITKLYASAVAEIRDPKKISAHVLAEKYGVTKRTVWAVRSDPQHSWGYAAKALPKEKAKGSRVSTAKLSESDVVRIKQLLKTEPDQVIAEMFGVKRAAISKIRNGRNWKHIQ